MTTASAASTSRAGCSVAVPVGSLVVAFVLIAIVLLATGHDPLTTYQDALRGGVHRRRGARPPRSSVATPILFTGLAAAAAFRMNLFNIGGEGQLYFGAIAAVGVALYLGDRGSRPLPSRPRDDARRDAAGAAWALIPGILRAFFSTNEIITSLMLNYVAGLVLTYLIFDSQSYWRDTTSPRAAVFPLGKRLPDAASWPTLGSQRRRPVRVRGRDRSRRSCSGCSTRARASASRCR